MKTTKILNAALFASAILFIGAASAQENATFIVQGEVRDEQGFKISESYILPLTDNEHIAQARALLAIDSFDLEDRKIVATIEPGGDGSNRNYSLPERPAWSWRIKEFIRFEGDIHIGIPPERKHYPSGIEEDPEAWIAKGGEYISDLRGFYIVAELSDAGETEFINISTRGFVGSGEQVLVAGFIIPEGATKTVLIRGIGPSLAEHGVQDPLLDPKIIVYKGSSIIAQNDNWQDGQSLKQFDYISERFLPTRDQEAAFLITRAWSLHHSLDLDANAEIDPRPNGYRTHRSLRHGRKTLMNKAVPKPVATDLRAVTS